MPSLWVIAAMQVRDPMNIMLVAVVVISLLIGELSTGIIVALLILLNVEAWHPPGTDGEGECRCPRQDAGSAGSGGP